METRSRKMRRNITVEVFHKIIQKEWEKIEKSTYVNLVHSMPSRLNEIMERNGNKISY